MRSKEIRENFLQQTFAYFQQMSQWIYNPNQYSVYFNKILGIIETLEIIDCRYIGGFDPKNPIKRLTGFNEFDRFYTLTLKYKTKLKPECYFTSVESMGNYWKDVYELREKYNNQEL